MVISLNKLLNINTIDTSNNYRFKQIKAELDKYPEDEEIILDFKYMEIKDSQNEDFKDIITDKRVKIVIYNDRDLYNTVNFIAIISGNTMPDKVKLVINSIAPDKTKAEKEIDRYTERFRQVSTEEDGTLVIPVKQVVQFIDRDSILVSLISLTDQLKDEYKAFIFDLNGIEMADEQIQVLASHLYVLNLNKRDVNVRIGNSKLRSQINTFIEIGKNGSLNTKQKKDLLDKEFPKFTAGTLTTFVSTGKKDVFGRSGNGEVATNLPAIYLGREGDNAVFKVFKLETFCRAYDYEFNHDNEPHPGLKYEIKKVAINQLGIGAYCIGSRYHFSLPVQFNEDGLQITYRDDGDKVRRITVSLPQHMMMVFDAWKEKYDWNTMVASIKITKDALAKAGIRIEN